MQVKPQLRLNHENNLQYTQSGYHVSKFWILEFGFWIVGIASLCPLIKQTVRQKGSRQAEYLKSKIPNPKSKILNKVHDSFEIMSPSQRFDDYHYSQL
jgi:hypothetical protein